MKHLLIILAITLTVVSCEKYDGTNPPTHEEQMYQMALDTLASINDLYALCIFYGDDEIGFYWNSPDSYCNNPDGSCDTTRVFPEPTFLRIEYSISFIGGFHTGIDRDYILRKPAFVPYDVIDSITRTAPNGWYRGKEIMAVYVNADRDEWIHDEDTVIVPSTAKSAKTVGTSRRMQDGQWAGWD